MIFGKLQLTINFGVDDMLTFCKEALSSCFGVFYTLVCICTRAFT